MYVAASDADAQVPCPTQCIMPKRAPRHDTELLRKRTTSAAVRLFSEHGFEGTSVQAIADAVGISKQALLYHFESKEGLRAAALEELLGTWRAVLPRLLSALTRPQAALEEAFSEVMSFFHAEPYYPRFLLQVLLQPAGSAQTLVQDVEPWLSVAGDFIRRAQQEGVVEASVDPEAWVMEIGMLLLASLSLSGGSRSSNVPDQPRLLREMARIVGSSLVGSRRAELGEK